MKKQRKIEICSQTIWKKPVKEFNFGKVDRNTTPKVAKKWIIAPCTYC